MLFIILTYAGLNVDPLSREEVLEVLDSELHQVPPDGRTFVQNFTSGTYSTSCSGFSGKTGGAELVSALGASLFPADQAELGAAHITVHGRAGISHRGSVVVRGAATHWRCWPTGLQL